MGRRRIFYAFIFKLMGTFIIFLRLFLYLTFEQILTVVSGDFNLVLLAACMSSLTEELLELL